MEDRIKLLNHLDSVDLPSFCQEVESVVSKGLHFAVYPDQKALWDTIKGTEALVRFISAVKAQFSLLFNKCGKGANKHAWFLYAWARYMLTHTGSSISSENQILWKDLIASYADDVSEDTK